MLRIFTKTPKSSGNQNQVSVLLFPLSLQKHFPPPKCEEILFHHRSPCGNPECLTPEPWPTVILVWGSLAPGSPSGCLARSHLLLQMCPAEKEDHLQSHERHRVSQKTLPLCSVGQEENLLLSIRSPWMEKSILAMGKSMGSLLSAEHAGRMFASAPLAWICFLTSGSLQPYHEGFVPARSAG